MYAIRSYYADIDAQTKKEEADKRRQAENAEIEAKEAIEQTRIENEKITESKRIEKEKLIRITSYNVCYTKLLRLIRAYNIGREEGLNFVYIGNYDDEDRESTYCPSCGFKVINRSGHIGQFVQDHLTDEGNCPKCDTSYNFV